MGEQVSDQAVRLAWAKADTLDEAAASVGLTPGYLRRRIRALGLLPRRRPQPVMIRGVRYSSVREAAEALGLDYSTITHARRRSARDRVGLPRPMPVVIRGQRYDSAKAAAEALDVSTGTIYGALARGALDTDGLSSRKRSGTVNLTAFGLQPGDAP